MFSQQHMSVGDWWLFYFLMFIPLVNIVLFIALLLSSNTNKTLKNMLWASIIPGIIVIILFFALGLGAALMEV